jgi:hypothetical protein
MHPRGSTPPPAGMRMRPLLADASLTASASAGACGGIKGKEENGGGAAGGPKSFNFKGQPLSRSKSKVKSDRAKEASPEEVEVAGSLLCS